MNREVIFRPAAEREMLEAERWFEERHSQLGQRSEILSMRPSNEFVSFRWLFSKFTTTNGGP